MVLLDRVTASLAARTERKSEAFKTLRKGLGYCWSVAVAELPVKGRPAMEKWLMSNDRDVRWIMRGTSKKDRLLRIDSTWVERWRQIG